MSLRIIGGEWRSRRLLRPENAATRPMPDRVKQSIFNVIEARFGCPGALPPFRVADVFAGSGSMGLEALSRGAARCDFYESERVALKALQANIESLGASNVANVKSGNAWTDAARHAAKGMFDLMFLDPPYRESEDASRDGLVGTFLARIAERTQVDAESRVPMVILHHFEKVRFGTLDAPAPWVVWDERKIGSSAVTYFLDRRDLDAGSDELPEADASAVDR